MPNWPSMYLPFFRDWGWISTYPDSRYVLDPMADYWALPYSATPAATYTRHSGLDAFSDWHHPIFAVEEGRVVEVLSAAKPNGNFGTFKYTGNIVAVQMEGGLVAIDEHMSETHVSEGNIVTAETRLGLQGTSGDSSGEHDHFKLFRDGQPIDPMPYLLGLKPWKTVTPVPPEVNDMANLVFAQKIRYTDSDNLAIHSAPNLDKTNIVGWITPNEVCTTDAIVNLPNGMTLMHESRGWFSTGGPDRYWFEPVADNSAEIETLKLDKAALVAERDNNIAEVDRLNGLIAIAKPAIETARNALG